MTFGLEMERAYSGFGTS